MQTLAVIIVSWNVRDLLDRCLETLQADLERTQALSQVWVVDNASTDGSAALVREKHTWVNLETPEENLGFVRGNNLVLNRFIAQHALPDFVWLLNPDTEVKRGATEKLLTFMNAHPGVGLVGPKLLNPDGSLQQSAFHFPGLLQPLFDLGLLPARFYASGANGRYSHCHYAAEKPFQIDHPLGAAMMARGTAVMKVGSLDERYFMYCEEIDWAFRMKKAGWQAWLVPEAEVIHHGGASTGQVRPQTTSYLWRSRAMLYKSHYGLLTRAIVATFARRYFARQSASSPEWQQAYQEILQAWR